MEIDMQLIRDISVILGVIGVLFGYLSYAFKKAEKYKLLQIKVKELEKRVALLETDMRNVKTEMKHIQEIKLGIDDLKKSLSIIEKFILGVADKDDVISNITNR